MVWSSGQDSLIHSEMFINLITVCCTRNPPLITTWSQSSPKWSMRSTECKKSVPTIVGPGSSLVTPKFWLSVQSYCHKGYCFFRHLQWLARRNLQTHRSAHLCSPHTILCHRFIRQATDWDWKNWAIGFLSTVHENNQRPIKGRLIAFKRINNTHTIFEPTSKFSPSVAISTDVAKTVVEATMHIWGYLLCFCHD